MAKLVRDKIPEIIKDSGRLPVTHIAAGQEYKQALLQKLNEEAQEVGSAQTKEDIIEEIADVLEVLATIMTLEKINPLDVTTKQKEKRAERGGFTGRVILDETK